MIKFLLRFIGYWALAATIVMGVVDGSKSIAASAFTFTPLGEIWFQLAPTTLNQVQFGIEQNLGAPWLWDFLTVWILVAPAWLVFGVLALILLLLGRRRRRVEFYDEDDI